ncbi:MAG: rhodanese-like domain-containing protein [Nitrospirota bacterium]|nr:rhodanese-like domain-containing protein [Nitrospirota bacterium]
MKKIIVLFFISLIFMVSYASAKDFKSISADELKRMFDKKTKLVLVDARTEMEYAQGHIPKAVNIPPEKLGGIETVLPKNKKALMVFYCRGVG